MGVTQAAAKHDALAAMGLIKNNLRLPLTPMRKDTYAKLEPILKNLALIK